MHDPEFEQRVLRFENAWQRDGSPRLLDFLDDPFAPSGPARERLLLELICIDLEYGWQSLVPTERITLEGYVEQFPELVSLDRLPLELIGEEYRVRRRWGDRPSHAEFLSRFQIRRDQIQTEVLQVDDELDSEEISARRIAPRLVPRLEPAESFPDGPLLSHQGFLLRRFIGAGRMGKVYEARPVDGHREVAVKFLRRTLLRHPEVVRRFIGESATIAKLSHPNTVGTQGLGRTPGGSYFIVMELVSGPNLAQVCSHGEVALAEAIRWVMATCEAVEHAHAMGIVHCDLKPANLLIDERGQIRVTDFGLARSLTEETPWTAEVEGTAPFMAPEQASRSWGPIDHRTDVYGLGAVLFTLLTGRPPILGRRIPDVLAQVVAGTPIASVAALRPSLPKSLSEICGRCLAKPPAQRYQSVKELHSALSRLHI